ncbi:MAG TPA: cupin domain-containing protein [Solirubrobacteraceae bacterium]
MATPYTLKNLTDIEDSAPKSGFGDVQEARFAKDALYAEDTGLSYHRLKAEQRQPFAHKHDRAEEVYVVVAGSGRVKLDDEVVELQALDAIRVAPEVTRAFEAGPSGLDLLAFGRRCDGDGEVLMGWWAD